MSIFRHKGPPPPPPIPTVGTIAINCNVSGTPDAPPVILSDSGVRYPGVFEAGNPSRCQFILPTTSPPNGWGAYLQWQDQGVRFAVGFGLPPQVLQPGAYEGSSLGLPTIAYATPIPAPLTREQVCSVNLTFQGLIVETPTYGRLPWFEACLPWLGPADRAAAYTAKHTAGDTHSIAPLPNGSPCYNEPGQPYYQFRELDWTAGQTEIQQPFIDLVVEQIQQGFTPLIFLPEAEADSLKCLPLVVAALKAYEHADLTDYCVILPGWDGVFYGWSDVSVIMQWAALGRQCGAKYLGIEFNIGHIPFGGGPSDYGPNARMKDFDVVFGELSDFTGDDAGESNYEVVGRLVQPYYPPASRPGDHPPYYLAAGTARGPAFFCGFEFGYAEYNWVRVDITNYGPYQAQIQNMRAVFKSLGCRHTG